MTSARWTGYVFADDARWPQERSTWTAAAVILAVDALSHTTGGSDIFRGKTLPSRFTEIDRCEPIRSGTAPALHHGHVGVTTVTDSHLAHTTTVAGEWTRVPGPGFRK